MARRNSHFIAARYNAEWLIEKNRYLIPLDAHIALMSDDI